MAQRKMSVETAERVWGKQYKIIPNMYFSEIADHMECKRCGKNYKPRSNKKMIIHNIECEK